MTCKSKSKTQKESAFKEDVNAYAQLAFLYGAVLIKMMFQKSKVAWTHNVITCCLFHYLLEHQFRVDKIM